MEKRDIGTSKFLSLVLRHKPDTIGLTLDANGWVDIDVLLGAARDHGKKIDRQTLDRVVATNDKRRFSISEDGTRIRAAQGHSVAIDLALAPIIPPEVLYHGTATRFLDSIMAKGLIPGRRRHVHLSADIETAERVGKRHGKPVVLIIDAAAMTTRGVNFYRSENDVWLTDHVPSEHLTPQ